ncbi:N-acetylglucosamine transport system permease protein [Catenulispora sp. MAP5-51]|uniref:carbohydrate ABC transporter permease n=1 Tax=Catenulispora sp. MAP5-51 TaxID=3156298 RepID=UPI0035185D2E
MADILVEPPSTPVEAAVNRPLRGGRSRRVRTSGGPFRLIGRPFVWAWAVFNVALLVWIALQSFRNGEESFSKPFGLPRSFNFDNYRSALDVGQLGSSFVNTVVIAGSATCVTISLASLAAYVLSRTRTRSASPLTTFFAMGMGIPAQAVILPMFVMMQSVTTWMNDNFGWWDDRLSLFLVYVATSLPFAVFLLTAFFRSLPSELEEAAALDGCPPLRVFFKVMLPLAKPGIITAFILTLMGLWNETLLALTFITDNAQYTLPQALLGLYGTMQYTSNWGGLFAGVVIVVLPIVILYVFLGRRIVEGMTLGAGK